MSVALIVPFDSRVPTPVTSRSRCRSEHFDFLKSVDRSTVIVVPPTLNVTFGQLPDMLETDPAKSTFFGGAGAGAGAGGVGVGVGVGLGVGAGAGAGEGPGAGVGGAGAGDGAGDGVGDGVGEGAGVCTSTGGGAACVTV